MSSESSSDNWIGSCPECYGDGYFLPEGCGCDPDDGDACPACTCDVCGGTGTRDYKYHKGQDVIAKTFAKCGEDRWYKAKIISRKQGCYTVGFEKGTRFNGTKERSWVPEKEIKIDRSPRRPVADNSSFRNHHNVHYGRRLAVIPTPPSLAVSLTDVPRFVLLSSSFLCGILIFPLIRCLLKRRKASEEERFRLPRYDNDE